MGRKILIICILLFLCISLGAINWFLNSSWFAESIIRRSTLNALSGVEIRELRIGRQRCVGFGQFIWYDFKFGLEYRGRSYEISAPFVRVSGVGSLLNDQSSVKIVMEDADFLSPPVTATQIKVELVAAYEWRKLVSVSGPVWIHHFKWDKFRAEKIAFTFTSKMGESELENFRARGYGGAVVGFGKLKWEDQSYSGNFRAEGIDTTQLAELSEQFAAKIVGRASGRVSLSGKAWKVSSLESNWDMVEGSSVNAGLFSVLTPVPVTQYIPQSREKKRLEDIIKSGGKIFVEILSFKIKAITPQKLSAELKIKSAEVNLQYNTTYDINLDGTWLSLLIAFDELLKGR